MRGFNRAIIAGNLARDPDVRHTVNKITYARFTVAVNSRYRDSNGEYQETADYISVVAWRNLAEIAEKYLKKDSPVLIEGRIRTGSYDAKDGSGKRYTTEIYVDNMIMLGSREGGSGSARGFSADGASSGSDSFVPSGMPAPNDFGGTIGDNGFGGSESMPDFGNDRNSMTDSEGSGIPF